MPRQSKDGPLDEVFTALASPIRREILDTLLRGPRAVAELADRFDMARPSVSEHLRALRCSGLVLQEQVGRQRVYRVAGAPLAQVAEWLAPYERFWRDRLVDLGQVLDGMSDGTPE